MENVRIAVRDSLDQQTLTFLDNSATGALHYTNDTLNRFVEGDASVFSCDVAKTSDDVQHLTVGNKLAFVWKGKDYWLNIIDTQEDEYTITIMAFSLSLELNNEIRSEYTSNGAMTFEQYLRKFDPERTLTLRLNEVSDKKIANEWTGSQTMLARLYSLANVFSAEIEFVTVLNDDYSLNHIAINVYREHSDTAQGIGENKTNVTLRFGKEIKAITRKENIKGIYTAITPVGKDGLNLAGYSRTEYDENGRVEFYTDNTIIRAPIARDRFPSFSNTNDGYISTRWETEYTTKEALYGAALAELKKNSVPQLEFEVDTYFDTNPGDTLTVESDRFKPVLIMEARVIEQVESFTDPSKNKTTFSNFKEIGSQIDSSLLAKVQQLIEANKKYEYQMISDNGIIFKNGIGQTTLKARVLDGVDDITSNLYIVWYKDGQHLVDSPSVTINAADINEKAVYRYIATNVSGSSSGGTEATVTNVNDGTKGSDGIQGPQGENGVDGKDAINGDGQLLFNNRWEYYSERTFAEMGWQKISATIGRVLAAESDLPSYPIFRLGGSTAATKQMYSRNIPVSAGTTVSITGKVRTNDLSLLTSVIFTARLFDPTKPETASSQADTNNAYVILRMNGEVVKGTKIGTVVSSGAITAVDTWVDFSLQFEIPEGYTSLKVIPYNSTAVATAMNDFRFITVTATKQGEKGDSGVIIQEEEPTPKIKDMLWQKPAAGSPIMRWNGEIWVIHQIAIDNIVATNLTVANGKFEKLEGTEIHGSLFKNTFSGYSAVQDAMSGYTQIEGATVESRYTGDNTGLEGYWSLTPTGYSMGMKQKNGNSNGIDLYYDRLVLRQNSDYVVLDYASMRDSGWITIPWALTGVSGTLQYRYYLGTFTLRFIDFVFNGQTSGNSPLAWIPSSVFVPTSPQMHLIPLWNNSGTTDTIQVNSDGGVHKVSNNGGATMARASFVVF